MMMITLRVGVSSTLNSRLGTVRPKEDFIRKGW